MDGDGRGDGGGRLRGDGDGRLRGDGDRAGGVEELLRLHAPQVLGALVRRYGHFGLAEDAVQEALLAAAGQWPADGVPANPRGWLIKVASRRLTDLLRAEESRRRREETAARLVPAHERTAPSPGESRAPSGDDTLTLLFLCCRPELSPAARVALTLRAVGGLTTAEIARAHLVPEATIARRVSRAKEKLRGTPFRRPDPDELTERLGAVLKVLYLIFTEGHTATSGQRLRRGDLAREAIRLTRVLRALLPDDGRVTGLLALMLLTDARAAARTGPHGDLVPLDEQDRALWDRAALAEGTALVEESLRRPPVGVYQVQAAVAALHGEAASARDTDWPQILALYDVLVALAPDPMAALGRAVALSMVRGAGAGLAELDRLEQATPPPGPFAGNHRLYAVRAHLLERAGEPVAARAAYQEAARRTLSEPEARYLSRRAARLAPGRPAPDRPAHRPAGSGT